MICVSRFRFSLPGREEINGRSHGTNQTTLLPRPQNRSLAFKLLKSGKMKLSPSCPWKQVPLLLTLISPLAKPPSTMLTLQGCKTFFFFLMQREEILKSLLSELNPS